LAEAVAVRIGARAFAHARAAPVTALAVVVLAVATDLGSTGVHTGVRIVAVLPQAACALAVAILVPVETILSEHQVAAVAVLVDHVAGHVACPRVRTGIGVVAVDPEAAASNAETVAVVVLAVGRAGEVHAVAVLVDVVAAHLSARRAALGIGVVAVRPVAARALAVGVQVAVGTVL
jgi:hypothetical protein